MDLFPGNELTPVCIHDEADAATLQILVHFLVVYHLTQ
jgi:hypothetical protein